MEVQTKRVTTNSNQIEFTQPQKKERSKKSDGIPTKVAKAYAKNRIENRLGNQVSQKTRTYAISAGKSKALGLGIKASIFLKVLGIIGFLGTILSLPITPISAAIALLSALAFSQK